MIRIWLRTDRLIFYPSIKKNMDPIPNIQLKLDPDPYYKKPDPDPASTLKVLTAYYFIPTLTQIGSGSQHSDKI